jgi:hypothetical protein
MSARCLALLSGKLDCVLAARLVQDQGVEVVGLFVQTPFNGAPERAQRAAEALAVPLEVVRTGDDYLAQVRDPRFGHEKGACPLLDCRIHLLSLARERLTKLGADFLVTGDVLGQRRMSQRRRDLEVIDFHARVEDIVVRPLSAKLLAPTRPEREGLVDRQRLFDFHGNSRRAQLALARSLGMPDFSSGGEFCALAQPQIAERACELIRTQPEATGWHYELLSVGRHFRLDGATWAVVGRRAAENDRLAHLHARPDAPPCALLEPHQYTGPTVLLVGEPTETAIDWAANLLVRHAKHAPTGDVQTRVISRDGSLVSPFHVT